MKLVDVKLSTYIGFIKGNNEKDPKFKVGNNVRISKYKKKKKSLEANVKIELDLSNYATKADLKNEAGVDTKNFTKKG